MDVPAVTDIDPDADNYDRCPVESDARHRWTYDEPPDHLVEESLEWGDAQWSDWHDQAGRTCWSCGERDEP